jgi:hypothetical protein
MASVEVERLLRQIELDQVVPVSYSRRSLLGHVAPLALTTVVTAVMVLLEMLTGHRLRVSAWLPDGRPGRRPAISSAAAKRELPPRA